MATLAIGSLLLAVAPAAPAATGVLRDGILAHEETPRASPDDSQRCSNGPVYRKVQAYLSGWLERRFNRVEVQPDCNSFIEPTLPATGVSLRVRALPDDLRPAARMAIWLDISVDRRPLRSLLVASRVRAYAPASIAAADMPAGARIDASQVRKGEIEVTASDVTPWSGDPVGQMLRSPVRQGAVLTSAQVATGLSVTRGQRVLAHSRMGGIDVQTSALALQDAAIGQKLQIRIDAAQGPVIGTLSRPGWVEVE